jgi:hypothetical protein
MVSLLVSTYIALHVGNTAFDAMIAGVAYVGTVPNLLGIHMAEESRLCAATPSAFVTEMLSGLFIAPVASQNTGKVVSGRAAVCSPTASDKCQGAHLDEGHHIASKFGFESFDSNDTTTSRTPKRHREVFEDATSSQNACDEVDTTRGVQAVRCPKPTYPDNFKSSRSRSTSDATTTSNFLMLPLDGIFSLPGSPRASINTVSLFPTASATPADASPFTGAALGLLPVGGRERTAGGEVLRFMSIATPSPSATSTPRALSRSCSRNSSTGGSARQLTRKLLPALPSQQQQQWGLGGWMGSGWGADPQPSSSACSAAACADLSAAAGPLQEEGDEEAEDPIPACTAPAQPVPWQVRDGSQSEGEDGELAAAFGSPASEGPLQREQRLSPLMQPACFSAVAEMEMEMLFCLDM